MTCTIRIGNFLKIDSLLDQLPAIESIKEGLIKMEILYNCGDFVFCEIWAILACYINTVRAHGIHVHIGFDTNQVCDTVHYASRVNFFQLVGIPYEENFNRRDSKGRFTEITPFNHRTAVNICSKVVDLIQENTQMGVDVIDSMDYCLMEIIDNADRHSRVGSGFVFAQRFGKTKTQKILVVDGGIGIHQSLRSNPKFSKITENQALDLCVKQGVSCSNSGGNGLFFSQKFIQLNSGNFSLYSGNSCFSIQNGSINSVRNAPYWGGTLVFLEINEQIEVRIEDVVGSENVRKRSLPEDPLW